MKISNSNSSSVLNSMQKNQRSLEERMMKIASASRVYSAKEDAAGLAISQMMSAQTQSLQVASNNAADATSVLQIADGALSSIGDATIRMRELAMQAGNGTLSTEQRAAIDMEYSELSAEVAPVPEDHG